MKVALLLLAIVPIPSVRLNPQTVKEFQAYMEVADRSMTQRAIDKTRLSLPANGEPRITPWDRENPRGLTDGLVHDWIAASFIPKAKVADVVAVLQDYEHYRDFYQPDVIDTRLISQSGDTRKIRMRALKKKLITVTLDIDYDVEYRTMPNGRVQVWSRSTAIREVDNGGKPDESVGPPDKGAGFLWRLNTYWQLEDREGGVYMECRAVSLTRDIPLVAAWAVKPMVTALPRESLSNTLGFTRAAVEARLKR
jgi:hypothetical protein